MAERPTQGYIPPNLSEDGGVFGGMFKIRNLVEAGVCAGLAILLARLLYTIIPYVFVMLSGVVVALLVGIVALIGVRGEPLSVFIINIISYRRTCGYVPMRMPMPMSVEAKENKKGGEPGKFEKGLANLLNGR